MSYERDILNILRVSHSWLGPCPADGKLCRNCEAAHEIEALRDMLSRVLPWAQQALWEESFKAGPTALEARRIWEELFGNMLEGRS